MHVTFLLFLCEIIDVDLPSESHLRQSKQRQSPPRLSWPLLGDSALPGTKHLGRSHDIGVRSRLLDRISSSHKVI